MMIKWTHALPFAVLLLASACGGDDYYYDSPPVDNCINTEQVDGDGIIPSSRTTTLTIAAYEFTVYRSRSGPSNFKIQPDPLATGAYCSYARDAKVTVPPGVYALEAAFKGERGKTKTFSWTLDSVELLPHVKYRLTQIELASFDTSEGKWQNKLTSYPLILRRYDLLDDINDFEVATLGPYEWSIGLTKKQIKEGLKIIRAETHTDSQFHALRDGWLAENERIIAGSTRAAAARVSAYQYQGRYALTRGDSCAEDTPLFSELFMEISLSSENSEKYYVSFGGFLYDDENSATWTEKPGPEGALLSVIEDPIPAMGETNFRPMIFQHRMTLKPLNANHLMISDWTRTEFDRESKSVLKTVDMMVYTNNSGQNAYIDHVGSNGYCLKRISGVSG